MDRKWWAGVFEGWTEGQRNGTSGASVALKSSAQPLCSRPKVGAAFDWNSGNPLNRSWPQPPLATLGIVDLGIVDLGILDWEGCAVSAC